MTYEYLFPPLALPLQVYDGSKAHWQETDPCCPVNEYGRSKLAAEQHIQQHWPRHVILRSSIIYGLEPPHPVGRALFLQFIEASLRKGEPTSFFSDEFRCPIYVQVSCKYFMSTANVQTTGTLGINSLHGSGKLCWHGHPCNERSAAIT